MTLENKKLIRGLCSVSGDIIHHGHIHFIKECKKACDVLIVAIPTDICYDRYRGRRPILSFDERAEIISEIKGVNIVVTQHDFDNWKVLREWLAPDIVFDSYEHKGKREGADVYVPYTNDISSTMIKERIIEAARNRT